MPSADALSFARAGAAIHVRGARVEDRGAAGEEAVRGAVSRDRGVFGVPHKIAVLVLAPEASAAAGEAPTYLPLLKTVGRYLD